MLGANLWGEEGGDKMEILRFVLMAAAVYAAAIGFFATQGDLPLCGWVILGFALVLAWAGTRAKPSTPP